MSRKCHGVQKQTAKTPTPVLVLVGGCRETGSPPGLGGSYRGSTYWCSLLQCKQRNSALPEHGISENAFKRLLVRTFRNSEVHLKQQYISPVRSNGTATATS